MSGGTVPDRRIVPLRTGHARSVIVSVEGVPPGYRAEQTIAKVRARS